MDVMSFLESIFRWFHVVAGILWIGLLYFLNFVNAGFEGTLDAESKRKVVPELRPRVLFWFRMGAAVTWILGALLLLMVFYHGRVALLDPVGGSFGLGGLLMFGVVIASPFIYDALVKTAMKELRTAFVAGLVLAIGLAFVFELVGFGPRGVMIHLGSTFGTIMAFNVWFRIWPAQQKIITAIKNGEAPDAALVGLAGLRSRHNTYLSVPLVFFMLDQHNLGWATHPIAYGLVVLVGWGVVYHLYDRAAQVKGF